MGSDLLFTMSDPDNRYDLAQIHALIREAERQGHPVEKGSYLQGMTFRQLDALLHGRHDA
jgi:hypothetical protein